MEQNNCLMNIYLNITLVLTCVSSGLSLSRGLPAYLGQPGGLTSALRTTVRGVRGSSSRRLERWYAPVCSVVPVVDR